jgi:hypothetical protein
MSYAVMVKSTLEISKKFVAFSEYMNFKTSNYASNHVGNCKYVK